MIDVAAIKMRYEGVSLHLNERSRRLFAANEAQTAGRGGLAAVYEATGIARSTIGRGLSDLRNAHGPLIGRIRRPGGGRNPKTETEPGLVKALGDLVRLEQMKSLALKNATFRWRQTQGVASATPSTALSGSHHKAPGFAGGYLPRTIDDRRS